MNEVVTEALEKVGNKGLYQTFLGIILFLVNAQANMLIFGPTFIYMNPSFRCSFVEGTVDESIACPRIDQCTITSDFTIVATSGLYCDRQFERNLVQSAFAVGAFFGLFLVMYISDLNGRRFALIMAQIIGILSVILTIWGGYTHSVPILVIAQFVGGFSGQAMALLVYVLPSQYCDDILRQNMIICLNYAWAVTTVMIGVLYYVYNWWYNYLVIFVLLPFIVIFFITYFFLVQSPYFLHQEGLWDRYYDSLKTISMYNDTYLDQSMLLIVQHDVHKQIQTEQQETPFFDVICDPYYLKIILYLTFAEIGICIYYFGANYSLDLIGKDYGFNCILTGVIQFVAYIFLHFIVTKLPRRQGLIIACGIMAALGLIFLIPSLVTSLTVQIIIIGLNRFIGTFVFTVLIMYLTELFPTKVQGTCMGIIDSGAQVGNFLAPIMVTICINKQIYPLVLFSVVIILAIIIPLSLVDDSRLNHEKMKEIQEQKSN